MRIHQFLSKSGIFSSKEAVVSALKSGKVKVGRKIVFSEHHFFDDRKERVYFNDELISLKKEVLIALNKPKGFVCAKLRDASGKKSVYALLPGDLHHLSCIGRLDENSEGLLLFTNNGDFLFHIISGGVTKKYVVTCRDDVSEDDLCSLREGVFIDLEENGVSEKYKTLPCDVIKLKSNVLEFVLREGKKRQIRRMLQSLSNKVTNLKRIGIGDYVLDDSLIPVGSFIKLSFGSVFNKNELENLKKD